jgi:acyl-CoA synthetase (NDP forming)
VPEGGSVTGPVDLTARVSPRQFQRVLELIAADEEVDAVVAIATPTAVSGGLATAIQEAAVTVPLTAVLLDQAESVRLLDGADGHRVPAFDSPEAAARALARAAAYGEWRAQPKGIVPAFTDVAAGPARDLVHSFLVRAPGGGWLSVDEVTSLLTCYGLELQPMTADGMAVRIDITDDHVFGPLISLGLDGPTAAPGELASRLVPLTTTDAEGLVGSVRAAPLVRAYRSGPEADLDALSDLLLRVARLAEDRPEISELSLAPVIARPDGVFIVDAQVRVMPFEPHDPFLRRLR